MARNPLRLLSSFTTEQHDHMSTAQAATVDVTPADLVRLVRAGLLVRVHRGVYRMAGAAETQEGKAMAAVLAAGEGAALSHSWAAWLHGLDRVTLTDEPEVIRVGLVLPRIPEVAGHATRELERCDVTTIRGIPVTTGARTVIDLADARLTEAETMAVTDDLICSRAPSTCLRRCTTSSCATVAVVSASPTRCGRDRATW